MASAPTSLVDRAGLDRPRLAKIISRGLDGADDGELFLEYRQAEMLVVRQRPAQAGDLRHLAGFRAARGEGRGGRLRACLRPLRGGDRAAPPTRCARSRAAIPAVMRGRRRAPTSSSIARTARSAAPGFESQGPTAAKPSTPMPAPRIRGCARSRSAWARTWQAVEIVRADGRNLSRRPPAGARQRLGRGRRRRPQETGSAGLWRPSKAMSVISITDTWQDAGRRGRAPGAGQSRRGAGAGRRDGRRARARLARRHAARGDRPRARRRFQSQEDLGLRRD